MYHQWLTKKVWDLLRLMWTEDIQLTAKMNKRLKIHQFQRRKVNVHTAFLIHSAMNPASTLVNRVAQRSISLFVCQRNCVICSRLEPEVVYCLLPEAKQLVEKKSLPPGSLFIQTICQIKGKTGVTNGLSLQLYRSSTIGPSKGGMNTGNDREHYQKDVKQAQMDLLFNGCLQVSA